jgi:phosphatidylcholine synthase
VRASLGRQAAAWGVHLLTASGAPAGVLAILAIERGDAAAAFWWMAYTLAVDSFDGALARAVGVKQVLPFFDGTRLDDIVDYFTYVIVPALFLIRMDVLPDAVAVPVALSTLLASAYGFCRTDAKTTDHYFTGFPSYWNIVAFYLVALGPPPWVGAAIVIALAVLVFVPMVYVYPSRTPTLRALTIALGLAWAAGMLAMIWRYPHIPSPVLYLSLGFPVYYVVLSLVLDIRRRRSARR